MKQFSERKTAKLRYEQGKMAIGSIYSGCCCPECANYVRWRKRIRNWCQRGKATLRNHRNGNFRRYKRNKTDGWKLFPDPVIWWTTN